MSLPHSAQRDTRALALAASTARRSRGRGSWPPRRSASRASPTRRSPGPRTTGGSEALGGLREVLERALAQTADADRRHARDARAGLRLRRDAHRPGPARTDDRRQPRAGRVVPPRRRRYAINFRTQAYRGKPVLTWWEGEVTKIGTSEGENVIVDQSYKTIARVDAGNGYSADVHEFLLTPAGTALITVHAEKHRSTSPRSAGRRRETCSTRSSRRSTSPPGRCCSSGTASTTSR